MSVEGGRGGEFEHHDPFSELAAAEHGHIEKPENPEDLVKAAVEQLRTAVEVLRGRFELGGYLPVWLYFRSAFSLISGVVEEDAFLSNLVVRVTPSKLAHIDAPPTLRIAASDIYRPPGQYDGYLTQALTVGHDGHISQGFGINTPKDLGILPVYQLIEGNLHCHNEGKLVGARGGRRSCEGGV